MIETCTIEAQRFTSMLFDAAEKEWDATPQGLQERIGGTPAKGDLYVYRIRDYSGDIVRDIVDTERRDHWLEPKAVDWSAALVDIEPVARVSSSVRRFSATNAYMLIGWNRDFVPYELARFGQYGCGSVMFSLCRMVEVPA